MKNKKIILICCCLLFSTSLRSFGQRKVIVEGVFNENDTCKTAKSTASICVLVKMVIAGRVYQSTFINNEGFFKFYKLCTTTNYKLEFTCLGWAFKPVIKIKEKRDDKIVFDCRFNINHFTDSLFKLKDFKSPNAITYEYCGYPAYSDFRLSIFSNKYGLRYKNMGCYAFDEKEVNKEAIKKLNKSLGDNWEKVFWNEIELKLK
jgi:hypothetical protein